MVKNCPSNMTQSQSIELNIRNDDSYKLELLKKSEKDGTLKEFLKDQDKNNLAFLAADQDDKDCLRILIAQGVNLSAVNEHKETVLDAIFEKVSTPEKFFSEVLDSRVALKKSNGKRNKIYKIDFRLLRPEKDIQMAVISNLCEASDDRKLIKILQHPLFEIYLQLKWWKVVYFFYFWIFLHIISVLFMSAYVTLLTYNIKYHDDAIIIIRYVMYFIAPTLFIYGFIQTCLINPVRLCKYDTWMNLITTILVLVVLGMETWSEYGARLRDMPNWVLHVTSFTILLLWIELMMLIGRFPQCGYYAVIFCLVLKNAVKILLAFAGLIVGFALSFSIQFYDNEDYSNPWKAFVKTVTLMIGEYDYAEIFDISSDSRHKLSSFPRAIFLIFIIVTTIVMMNLIIGLAVDDIQKLEEEGHTRKLQKQAEFLTQIEQIIIKCGCFSPLFKTILKNCEIGETVDLNLSDTTCLGCTKFFSKKIRSALLQIVQSKRIKNLQSSDSNKDAKQMCSTVKQPKHCLCCI